MPRALELRKPPRLRHVSTFFLSGFNLAFLCDRRPGARLADLLKSSSWVQLRASRGCWVDLLHLHGAVGRLRPFSVWNPSRLAWYMQVNLQVLQGDSFHLVDLTRAVLGTYPLFSGWLLVHSLLGAAASFM